MTNQHFVVLASSLPGSQSSLRSAQAGVQVHRKRSVYDRLDKVFEVAEHVDAKCTHMLDAASHRRRDLPSAARRGLVDAS